MQETVKVERQEVPAEMVELSEKMKTLDEKQLIYTKGYIKGMADTIEIGNMKTAAAV